jgi:hypothetical protein
MCQLMLIMIRQPSVYAVLGVNKVLTSISINVVSFRLTIFGNNMENRVPTGVGIDSLCILRNIPGENNVLNMYEE